MMRYYWPRKVRAMLWFCRHNNAVINQAYHFMMRLVEVRMCLKKAPSWVPREDRHCRACNARTDYVMVAEGWSRTYPCCDNPSCQKIVGNKIKKSLSKVAA